MACRVGCKFVALFLVVNILFGSERGIHTRKKSAKTKELAKTVFQFEIERKSSKSIERFRTKISMESDIWAFAKVFSHEAKIDGMLNKSSSASSSLSSSTSTSTIPTSRSFNMITPKFVPLDNGVFNLPLFSKFNDNSYENANRYNINRYNQPLFHDRNNSITGNDQYGVVIPKNGENSRGEKDEEPPDQHALPFLDNFFAEYVRRRPKRSATPECRRRCGSYDLNIVDGCDCHKHCFLYKSCCQNVLEYCVDIWKKAKQTYDLSKYENSQISCDGYSGAYTVTSCPFDEQIGGAEVEVNITENNLYDHILSITPVYDTLTQILYKNIRVFECYKEPWSSPIFFNLVTGQFEPQMDGGVQDIISVLISRDYNFFPPWPQYMGARCTPRNSTSRRGGFSVTMQFKTKSNIDLALKKRAGGLLYFCVSENTNEACTAPEECLHAHQKTSGVFDNQCKRKWRALLQLPHSSGHPNGRRIFSFVEDMLRENGILFDVYEIYDRTIKTSTPTCLTDNLEKRYEYYEKSFYLYINTMVYSIIDLFIRLLICAHQCLDVAKSGDNSENLLNTVIHETDHNMSEYCYQHYQTPSWPMCHDAGNIVFQTEGRNTSDINMSQFACLQLKFADVIPMSSIPERSKSICFLIPSPVSTGNDETCRLKNTNINNSTTNNSNSASRSIVKFGVASFILSFVIHSNM